MNHMHILSKVQWGDFDARLKTPLYASENKEALEAKAAELNANRKPEDFVFGEWKVFYVVEDRVKVI